MFARLWSGVSRTAVSTLLVAVALVVAVVEPFGFTNRHIRKAVFMRY